MANPVFFDIPINTWVLVAANVVTGAVLPLRRTNYVQTIRDAGSLVLPVNGDLAEGKEVDYHGEPISDSIARDVYIAVTGSVAGRVRVDL